MKRRSRVTLILEAQKRVEFAADCLRILAANDPRFESILDEYRKAIEDRRKAEQGSKQ